MIWSSYDWLNKSYSFYVAAVVGVVSRRGLRIEVHRRRSKLTLYKSLISLLQSLTIYNISVVKVGVTYIYQGIYKKKWFELQVNGFGLLVI